MIVNSFVQSNDVHQVTCHILSRTYSSESSQKIPEPSGESAIADMELHSFDRRLDAELPGGVDGLVELSLNCSTEQSIVANCSIDDGLMTSSSNDTAVAYDALPSNDVLYVHPHWLTYRDVIDEAPVGFMYLLGVYMVLVCFVGIVGNSTVIVVFLRTASLRTPSNYYVINLAFSDAAFCLSNGFPLMSIACFKRKWMWGQIACEWYGFLGGVFGMNSIGTLTLIAIDRYFSISRPLEMLYKATPRRAIMSIIFIWSWSIALACPPLIGWGRYIAEGFQVSCSFDYLTRSPANITFNYYLVVVGFAIPVAVIIWCYVGIVRYVSSHQPADMMRGIELVSVGRGGDASHDRHDQARQNQEIRRAKSAAIMIVLFILSWTPYALIAQFGIIGLDVLVTPYSTEFPIILAKASAIWNPIVYALTHPRYKIALQQLIPCCRYILPSTTQSSSGSRSEGRLLSWRQQQAQSQQQQQQIQHQCQSFTATISPTTEEVALDIGSDTRE